MSSLKESNVKSRTHYFFNEMINIKHLDLNKIKIDENSYKNMFVCHIGYVAVKDLSYKVTIVNCKQLLL